MSDPEPMGVIRECLSLSDFSPYVPEQSDGATRPSLHPCACDYSASETHRAEPGMSLRLPQRRTGTIDGPALPDTGGQSGPRIPALKPNSSLARGGNAFRRPGIAEAYRSAVSLMGQLTQGGTMTGEPPHPPLPPHGSAWNGEPYTHPPGPPPPRRSFTVSFRMLLIVAVVAAVAIAVVVGLIVASKPSPTRADSSNSLLGERWAGAMGSVFATVPMFGREPIEA